MISRKNIVLTAVVCGMLGCLVAATQAEVVVNYELRIAGSTTGSGTDGAFIVGDSGLAVDTPFDLEIWAMVTGTKFRADFPLGLVQYQATISDSSGNTRVAGEDHLIPTELVGGPPMHAGLQVWKGGSTYDPATNATFGHYAGNVNMGSHLPDVNGQTGQRDNAAANANSGYAGEVWEKVGWGEYTWDGQDATLTLSSETAANAVWWTDQTTMWITDPESTVGDSITFSAGGGGTGTAPTANVTVVDGAVDVTTDPNDTAILTADGGAGTGTMAYAWSLENSTGGFDPAGTSATLTVDETMLNNLGWATPAAGNQYPVGYQVTVTGDTAPAGTASGTIQFIPEPSSIIMLLSGLVGLAMCWWRRR